MRAGGKNKAAVLEASKKFKAAQRRLNKGNILSIKNGAIRRLCRRAGVKRISHDVYQEVRRMIRDPSGHPAGYLDDFIRRCSIVLTGARQKTVNVDTVKQALRSMNMKKFY